MNEWQPIATAPKDRPILLALGKIVGTGEWRPAHHWAERHTPGFYFDGATLPAAATHWMPLPAPPIQGG